MSDGGAGEAPSLDDFERFYRAHVGRVHALCLRMAGDARRAEELTQDVFVRAWERRASYRGSGAVGGWLHRLAANVVLAALRADRRRDRRVRVDEDAGRSATVRGAVATAAERLDLERAIALLPRGARIVFVLHDVEGYTHEEIARLTGTRPGTVRAQLFRARHLLMEMLDR